MNLFPLGIVDKDREFRFFEALAMVMMTSSMSTAHRVKQEIDLFDKDHIFTTQQLLYLGGRNAIDATLCRLVKAKAILRLARGVFVKASADLNKITTIKVATVKANAFGKTICIYGESAAFKLGLIDTPTDRSNKKTFYTSGASSSFKFGRVTVQFKSACPKKRTLPEDKSGLIIKAVWHFGRRSVFTIKPRARYIAFNQKRQKVVDFKNHLRKSPLWILKTFYPSLA